MQLAGIFSGQTVTRLVFTLLAQIIHSRVQQTETCGSPQHGRNFGRWRLLQGRRPPYPQVRMPNFGGLWMANRSGWIGGKRGRR